MAFRTLFAVSAIGLVFITAQAPAASVTYTIDPTQSSLLATGTLSGNVPSSQTFGSNLTTYNGTISADRTATSIQFVFGSLIDADRQPSKQQPDIGTEAVELTRLVRDDERLAAPVVLRIHVPRQPARDLILVVLASEDAAQVRRVGRDPAPASSVQRRHTGSFVKCAAFPPKSAKSASEGRAPST